MSMHLPPLLLPDVRFGAKKKKSKKNAATAGSASTETKSQGGLANRNGQARPSSSWQAWLTQVQTRVLTEQETAANGNGKQPDKGSVKAKDWRAALGQLLPTELKQPAEQQTAATEPVSASPAKSAPRKAAKKASSKAPEVPVGMERPPEDQLRPAMWYDIIKPGTVLYKAKVTDINDPAATCIVEKFISWTVITKKGDKYEETCRVRARSLNSNKSIEYKVVFTGKYVFNMASPHWLVKKEAHGSKEESRRDLGYA